MGEAKLLVPGDHGHNSDLRTVPKMFNGVSPSRQNGEATCWLNMGIVNLICLSQLTEMAMHIRFPIRWTDDDDIPRTNMRP